MWKARFSSHDNVKIAYGPKFANSSSTFMGNYDRGHGDIETLFPVDNIFGGMSLFVYAYCIK